MECGLLGKSPLPQAALLQPQSPGPVQRVCEVRSIIISVIENVIHCFHAHLLTNESGALQSLHVQ